jgi:acyl-CoA synthetase (AMP-forming)/AMP-acid ligase II
MGCLADAVALGCDGSLSPFIAVPTSGSTGEPKIIYHDVFTISAMVSAQQQLLQLGEESSVMANQIFMMLPVLAAGARIVGKTVNPGRNLTLMSAAEPDYFFSTVWELSELVSYAEQADKFFPATTHLITGAGPVPGTLIRRALERGSGMVTAVYAATEATPIATATYTNTRTHPGEGNLTEGKFWGALVDGVEAKVADDGELWVRGDRVGAKNMSGKFTHPGGWMPTGDIVRLDTAGNVWGLGRKKRMLLRYNRNIYPEMVETVLRDSLGGALKNVVLVADGSSAAGDGTRGETVTLIMEKPSKEIFNLSSDGDFFSLYAETVNQLGQYRPDHVFCGVVPQTRNGKPSPVWENDGTYQHLCGKYGFPSCFTAVVGE